MARGIMWEVPYAASVGKHVGEVLIDATRRGCRGREERMLGFVQCGRISFARMGVGREKAQSTYI